MTDAAQAMQRRRWPQDAAALQFWIMVLLPLAVCGSFAWLFETQRGVQERANEQMASLQYAAADLTEGLTQIYMADASHPLFDRMRGLVLLRQAVGELQRAVQLLQNENPAAAAELQHDLEVFSAMLTNLPDARLPDARLDEPWVQTGMRIAVFRLQQQVSYVADLVRSALTRQFDRMQYQLYAAIGVSLLLLGMLAWILRAAAQARAAALEETARADAALHESDKRFRALLEAATENVWVADADFRNFRFDPPWRDEEGNSRAQWRSRDWMLAVHPEDRPHVMKTARVGCDTKSSVRLDYRINDGSGGWRWLHARGTPVLNGDGKIVEWLGMTIDATERRLLEEKLHQAQKLEAIGQLTGGIAHDFNNLLAIILGNLELLDETVTEATQRELIAAALRATLRGSDLTHHLLAYARRQSLLPHVVDLQTYLPGLADLLQRSLGDRITVSLQSCGKPSPVLVDVGQLETALLNLAVNARDAIAGSGTLSISLDWISGGCITAIGQTGSEVPPDPDRQYASLILADSGSGMPPEIVARAFDPFFTTKEAGKGSGLGLSMVHGFVRQSNGYIGIESQPGIGSQVKIFLPLANASALLAEAENEQDVDPHAASGDGPGQAPAERPARLTVLLVEDNAEVGKVMARMLEELGHAVTMAETAEIATALLAERQHGAGRFDLLLTDIQLPGRLDGVDLVEAATAKNQVRAAIFMSGWEAPEISSKRLSGQAHPFLHKPVRKTELQRAIAEALPAVPQA